jgi:curved DNA-binding protein CbpA
MADSLENQYDNENFIDFYEILDVDMEATVEEIKKKYIEMAKKFHPDQKTGNVDIFQKISKAYEVLSNKDTRKEYDLYFLKKSYSDLKEDTFFSMKDQFREYLSVNENKKKMTKEELDKIYDDVFKDRDNFVERILDVADTIKRINDINFEREATNIETTDEQLKSIIENNPDLQIGQVLEYIKETTKNTNVNTEIINKDFGTLDTLPGYFDNTYSSFIDETEILPSSFYTMLDKNSVGSKEQVKNFNLENFNEWKNNRKPDSRLDSHDIDMYLARRKEEEQQLLEEVETTLVTNVKRRTDVETFLKPKDKSKLHINEEDIVKVESVNNVKKRNF